MTWNWPGEGSAGGPSRVQLLKGNATLVVAHTVNDTPAGLVKPNWKLPFPSTSGLSSRGGVTCPTTRDRAVGGQAVRPSQATGQGGQVDAGEGAEAAGGVDELEDLAPRRCERIDQLDVERPRIGDSVADVELIVLRAGKRATEFELQSGAVG